MNQYRPFYMMCDAGQFTGDYGIMDDERMAGRDYEYMKSVYPETAKRVMPYVEEECERLEYQGSMMFDEYPDQLLMRLLCRRIYDKVQEQEKGKENLFELIQVLTYHEILRRRRENRKYVRKIFF